MVTAKMELAENVTAPNIAKVEPLFCERCHIDSNTRTQKEGN